ncbi:MAG: dihydropteroate synthase [Demequinaceae bacterium]|nr:dihydropteroate synthase [Demequinaceae bacterium]
MGTTRCLVMGILNVTPDSFSDGGRWEDVDLAIARGLELRDDGADIVDVGGDSTRPGAERIDANIEMGRVRPVVMALTREGVTVSVDTMRASTAAAAIDVGATIVNDVSGGLSDPAMAPLVAEAGVDYVAMHWRAPSGDMDAFDRYEDVVREVRDELEARVEALVSVGVDADRIILDPGLGFAKVAESNWPLLAHLECLQGLGHRVLVGASRKRFLGSVLSRDEGPLSREHATTAVTALAAAHGVWAVRVHDAGAARDALHVVDAWQAARSREG